MSPASSRGGGLFFSLGVPGGERPRADESSFVVLVAADCSGRAARGVRSPLAGREARAIDVERLEGVMRGWAARVPTPWLDESGASVWLEPRSLDDLHPDVLLGRPPLGEIEALRRELGRDPGAAARLQALLRQADAARATPPTPSAGAVAAAVSASPAPAAGAEKTEDTLARLLGGQRVAGASADAGGSAADATGAAARGAPAASAAAAKLEVQKLISALVGGGAAPRPGPPAVDPALAAAAEAELGRRLRALLAAPAVRGLEATWRGIDGLCRENPDEERVRQSVLDVSFDELAADLGAVPALLERHAPDVLVLDHCFGPESAQLRALGELLGHCAARGVTLLAAAHPHLAGYADFAEHADPPEHMAPRSEETRAAWAEVQARREAGARLGLVLPRFILRQPYGRSGDPIEHFPFEEILDDTQHEAFSWGNGAYLLARVLSVLHADAGRALHPDGSVTLRGLPVVHLEREDGIHIKPCAEAWLSERTLGQLRGAGFSVLNALRDSDRIRIYP